MEILKGISSLSHTVAHPVVIIGNFDGVHIGHQRIVQLAMEKAKARQGQCVVYTFRPHPQVALRPSSRVQLLSTYEERAEMMAGLGVDVLIEEPFSREFSTIEPEQFFTDILLHRLSAEAIVVGYDFAFGRERHGHLDALSAFCKATGVELTVVQPQRVQSEVVSSSKIRQHLLSGEIEVANGLLGREFFYRGIVVKGEGRGRKMGFPTANLSLQGSLQSLGQGLDGGQAFYYSGDKLNLPVGVYATWAVLGTKHYPSVTNIGVRPTFHKEDGGSSVLVETHLLDTSLDLYGSQLEVRFVSRLRAEQKFAGVEPLKMQIQKDIDAARQHLGNAV